MEQKGRRMGPGFINRYVKGGSSEVSPEIGYNQYAVQAGSGSMRGNDKQGTNGSRSQGIYKMPAANVLLKDNREVHLYFEYKVRRM